MIFDNLGCRLCLLGLVNLGCLEGLAFPTGWLAGTLDVLLEFGCATGYTECVERFSHFFRFGRHDEINPSVGNKA